MKHGSKIRKPAGNLQILLLGLSCLLFLCSGCANAGRVGENADIEARSDTQNTDAEAADAEEFRYAFCLANAELDPETEQIVCWTRDGAAASETCYYEYDEDGNLQMVREVYYHYDWETETDTMEVWELQNGEWLQVK